MRRGKIQSSIYTTTVSLGLFAAIASPALADPTLSVVTVDKNYNDGGVLSGGNSSYSLNQANDWGIFLAGGGLTATPAYINTSDASANLGIALALGTYQYTGYYTTQSGLEAAAMSLYFDGSSSPSISVFATAAGAPAYSAFGGIVAGADGASTTTGADALSFVDGLEVVTVTSFQFYDASDLSAISFPGVDFHVSSTADGTGTGTFNAFTFTLDVTPVPEPASALLLAPACLAMRSLRKRSAHPA